MTKSFIAYALDLLTFGTIKDVADHLNVGWDCIKDIHKKYLKSEYKEVDISDIEYLSIDEFSIAKRHKYMTIFLNLKTGRIVHAVEGRKKKDILSFLEDLKKNKVLKAIAMDMSKSYISAVKEYLPSIDIVFDRFHIMQIVNKTLDKIRCKQQAEMTKAGYKIVKGNRFLLLSNYDELQEEKKSVLIVP